MAEQANVSSIDALESFRSELIHYVEKARAALEDAEGEVRRARTWLDTDRTNHWVRQLKERIKKFDQSEAELYNAKITRPDENHAILKMAVVKAQRNIEEAEEKLRVLKHWRMQFDNRATPLLKRLDPAHFMVSTHLPKGIHTLGETIKILQAYAEKSAPVKPSAPTVMESNEGADS
jgi:uncharacterized coiled-coil protein SlyX